MSWKQQTPRNEIVESAAEYCTDCKRLRAPGLQGYREAPGRAPGLQGNCKRLGLQGSRATGRLQGGPNKLQKARAPGLQGKARAPKLQGKASATGLQGYSAGLQGKAKASKGNARDFRAQRLGIQGFRNTCGQLLCRHLFRLQDKQA